MIHLANDLEYRLYCMGAADEAAVRECQQAAGALIGCLREHLFRNDQEVFAALEALLTISPVF